MTERLATGMLVAALIRRAEAAGGSAAVLARGDATAGTLLVQLAHRGQAGLLVERMPGAHGRYRWQPTGPADPAGRDNYLVRRRHVDPDLWLLEVDAPDAAALVDEMTG